MKRDADYCSLVFGLTALEGYIPGYLTSDANYRRALDWTACSADAPMARRLRTALVFTYEKKNRAAHYVSVAGSLEALLTIHILAHTTQSQPHSKLEQCFRWLKEAGYEIPGSFLYARIKANEVRRDVAEQLEETHKRAAEAEAMRPMPVDFRGIADDDGTEVFHAYEFDEDLELGVSEGSSDG